MLSKMEDNTLLNNRRIWGRPWILYDRLDDHPHTHGDYYVENVIADMQ
jgi:hypothetical protein